jgi:superfamily II DNA or RNA helicase
MLGLSATAFRREDGMTKLIYTYLGDLVYSLDSTILMDSGAIVRPEFIQKETDFSYEFAGEYGKMIKALTIDDKRNNLMVADIAGLLNNDHSGTILVVSDRVAHCQCLKEKLSGISCVVALLTGKTYPEERERIVAMVREGRVDVLVSTLQLIGEGFDCQGLATVVLATPIKFEGRLLQVVGRVMRPGEGKKAMVIDYADVNVPVLSRSASLRGQVFKRWT